MSEIMHNKLVRDSIPDIITQNGDTPVWHTAEGEEVLRASLVKIVEEANEILESGGSLEEFADLKEVWLKTTQLLGYSEEMIETARLEKAKKRGGLSLNIILDKVVLHD